MLAPSAIWPSRSPSPNAAGPAAGGDRIVAGLRAPFFCPHAQGTPARPGPLYGHFVAERVQQLGIQVLPNPGVLPIAGAPPTGHPAAASRFLQHLPRGTARAEDEDAAGERGAVGDAAAASLGSRRLHG
jgi:hypothetical protein